MAALTLTAAAMPAANAGVAGIASAANSNGDNSAGYTFAGGSTGADTIANAQLIKGVPTTSRLYAFLTASYADQAAVRAAAAAAGFSVMVLGGNTFELTATAAAPTATVTTTGATGVITLRIGQSVSN